MAGEVTYARDREWYNEMRRTRERDRGNGRAWGEVGGWGRDPKKCMGRDWGMGSSTIS